MRRNVILSLGLFAVLFYPALLLANYIDTAFRDMPVIAPLPKEQFVHLAEYSQARIWFLLLLSVILFALAILVLEHYGKIYKSGQQHITPDISIPVAAGEGQFGTARFLTKRSKRSNLQRSHCIKETSISNTSWKWGDMIYLQTTIPCWMKSSTTSP